MDMAVAVGLVALGLLAGVLLQGLAGRGRAAAQLAAAVAQAVAPREAELAALRERAGRLAPLEDEVDALRDALAERDARLNAQAVRQSALAAELEAERRQAAEKLALLTQARTELSHQFKSLANDILEEKARRFAEQNRASLGGLLEPLKEKLAEFRGKVEEVYVQEGKDRSALAEQVRLLAELNRTMAAEANALTGALRGSAKTQGNWGELILERVLEASGLQKGQAYVVQDSRVRDDGSRAQPDVVIHLPGERCLVVDAKVSLVAYERHHGAETDADRAEALKQHLASVRTHLRGLSEKSYHDLYKLRSLDFVIMFVPIEPAFTLAVTQDEQLFIEAWQRNVLLVSPSTLLFVVRTVAYLWTQENQNRSAQDVASRGAELYDRLAGFVAEFEKLGAKVRDAQKHYDDAFKKLATGKGNVIRQAEMLKSMGVRPSKALPAGFVDAALAEEHAALPAEAHAVEPGGAAAHAAQARAVEAAMAAHPSRLPAAASLALPEPPAAV